MAAKKSASNPDEVPAKKVAKKAATKKAAPAKKAAKKAPEKKTAAKTVKKSVVEKMPPRPSLDAVAKAAYLIYRRRVEHGLPGDSRGDWLEAERQLLQ